MCISKHTLFCGFDELGLRVKHCVLTLLGELSFLVSHNFVTNLSLIIHQLVHSMNIVFSINQQSTDRPMMPL